MDLNDAQVLCILSSLTSGTVNLIYNKVNQYTHMNPDEIINSLSILLENDLIEKRGSTYFTTTRGNLVACRLHKH